MRASSQGPVVAACLAGLLAGVPALAQVQTDEDDGPAPLQLRSGLESRREMLRDDRAGLVPGDSAVAQRELSQVDMRLWATRGRYSLGVGLGAVSTVTVAPALGREPSRLVDQQVGPAVTVGWRAQFGDDATIYADTSTMPGRLVGDADNRAYFSTRGGIEWKLTESRFGFDRGRLSMRLDSGYRMSLRVRNGGVGLMLRGQF